MRHGIALARAGKPLSYAPPRQAPIGSGPMSKEDWLTQTLVELLLSGRTVHVTCASQAEAERIFDAASETVRAAHHVEEIIGKALRNAEE